MGSFRETFSKQTESWKAASKAKLHTNIRKVIVQNSD